jgi:MFS superfamily sulfate permease-like transporter
MYFDKGCAIMSTYKNSSETVEDGDTSSVSLMYRTSKDNENNEKTKHTDNSDETILDDNGQPEVNDIGKRSRVTSISHELFFLSTGQSEIFHELSNAIQNRNVERLQNVMNGLSKYLYWSIDFVYALEIYRSDKNLQSKRLIATALNSAR